MRRRSKIDAADGLGKPKRGSLLRGTHVAASAATPGLFDWLPLASSGATPLQSGGRDRLPPARDVVPHHALCSVAPAERFDAVGELPPDVPSAMSPACAYRPEGMLPALGARTVSFPLAKRRGS